jgi:hypothetical protein
MVSQSCERPMAMDIFYGRNEDEKWRLADIFQAEGGAGSSGKLGKTNVLTMLREQQEELERVMREKKARELKRSQEMAMAMGLGM